MPLESRRAFIEAIFDDLPDAIVIANPDRRIAIVNRAAASIFGWTAAEMKGQPTAMLYASTDEYHRQGSKRYNREGRSGTHTYCIDYRRKDGTVFSGETVGAVIRSDGATVDGYLGIIRDISARLAAEQEAELAQRRLQGAVDALHEGFALFDTDDRLVVFNERYRAIYSMISDIIAPGVRFEDIARAAAERGQVALPADGVEGWLADRMADHRSPPPDGIEQPLADGRYILHSERRLGDGSTVGVRVDITEQKRNQRTLGRLAEIASTPGEDMRAKVRSVLALGAEHFGLPVALASRIEGDRYEVLCCADGAVEEGTVFGLADTYCAHTVKAGEPVAVEHAAESEIARHPCYRRFKLETYIGAPLRVDGTAFGTIAFAGFEPYGRPLREFDRDLVRLFAGWIGTEIARHRGIAALRAARDDLRRLATTDELTGIPNRRHFLATGAAEYTRASRYGRPLTALMLDVDHFKSINDRFGHDTGDAVLVRVAEACRSCLRDSDIFGRLGGEEFAILLPETHGADASAIAERILAAVASTAAVAPMKRSSVTCSIGLAAMTDSDSCLTDVMKRADRALYRAKNAGRARAVAA